MTTLKDIFGQDEAIKLLSTVYEEGRLPHALIFAGPAGVGKATTARALAALFLCESPKGNRACGKCASCKLIEAGNHPDFHEIYRQLARLEKKDSVAKELAVDVIRSYLVESAARKSSLAKGKIFIVQEAELMNASAQNAMLKTLEEPAGNTLIVLLTDQPEDLLPTIRSRCQTVRFRPLDGDLVRSALQERGIGKTDAVDAARFAEGSLGLAIQWLGDGVVAHARELEDRLNALVAGREQMDLPEFLKGLAEEYAAKQLERDKLASKDQATREGLSLYFRLVGQFFRSRLSDVEEAEELEKGCAAVDALARADEYLAANVNTALILQQLAVTLEGLFARARMVN